MNKLLLAICLLLFNAAAYAEVALSKQLILKYFNVTQQLSALAVGEEAVLDEIEDTMMLDKEATLNAIKSLKVYPKIKSLVRSEGFESISTFLDTGYRVIGSMYAVQLEQNPQLAAMAGYASQVERQIEAMKARGMPADVIAEMEQEMLAQKKAIESMSKAAQDANAQDKRFVSDNLAWLMSVLPNIDS